MIIAVTLLETAEVEIVNVAEVAPAGTVTLPGATAELVLLEMAIAAPPTGAASASVTVHEPGLPPTTEVGQLKELRTDVGAVEEIVIAPPVPEVVSAVPNGDTP